MDKIQSQALAENLAQTQVKEIVLSPESQWLLKQSANYFGIQQRTKQFLEEYHHPYANWDEVLFLLRQSVFGDLWFYLQLPERDKALSIILDIFETIFKKAEKKETRQKTITEFLSFTSALAGQEQVTQIVLEHCVEILEQWYENYPDLFIPLTGQCYKTLQLLYSKISNPERLLKLLKSIYQSSLKLWKSSASIEEWYDKYADLITLSRSYLSKTIGTRFYNQHLNRLTKVKNIEELKEIPSFNDIAIRHRDLLAQMPSLPEKIHYIFYLLSLPPMNGLTDHLLWDFNRILGHLRETLSPKEINSLLDSVFDYLAEYKDIHTSIVLDCVLTIGKAVLDPQEPELGKRLIRKIIDLGFIPPGEIKINQDWQIIANKNHIKNIRVWLQLISINPAFCKDLLAALTIAIIQQGIFVSDTDLFQKDVSAFLNSNIKPIYVQVKHLLRLLPVFYNEIGAEGEIRDLSTEIDELCYRKDLLMHFVRKQVHTESNNTQIQLMQEILNYWIDLDPTHLKGLVPEDVDNYISHPDNITKTQHQAVNKFLSDHNLDAKTLLNQSWQSITPLFKSIKNDDIPLKKLELLCRIYYLLLDKYRLDPYDITKFLSRYNWFDQKEQLRLKQSLARNDYDSSIHQMLKYISRLNKIVLDPQPTQAWENIYYKRHIAAGIPSMYGQYREPKLEAMGMIFRLENLIERLIEKNIQQLNLEYLTAKTLKRIIHILELYELGLIHEGYSISAFSNALEMLKSSQRIVRLSLDQYLDLFKQIKDSITELINEYFYRFYEQELSNLPVKGATGKYKKLTSQQMFAEEFFRKLLGGSFLVQSIDNFITQIITSLNAMKNIFAPEDLSVVMSYDPDVLFVPLHTNNRRLDNQVLLGAKAYFLKKMIQYEFPIPAGIVITTELFRARNIIRAHPEMEKELDEKIRSNVNRIENYTGLEYGNPEAPLLLSVRSGAPMSLPGAMCTFLNIGMNDEITLKLSTMPNFGWTAWDCYRRLLQSWGMAYGIDRDEFDAVMINYKRHYKVQLKTQFTPDQMRQMCTSYKEVLAYHK
ncbi:MAG: pyruvate phosphate dikinase, partial [Candidatus Cloacimonetes bacterium]|nr:pyruvate phosphate dikinase [Candidatus Cloacimonadota bacterium]